MQIQYLFSVFDLFLFNFCRFKYASNNRPIFFNRWLKGQPNKQVGDCACLSGHHQSGRGGWEVQSCQVEQTFFCEKPTPRRG